jgi:hypothetical protein
MAVWVGRERGRGRRERGRGRVSLRRIFQKFICLVTGILKLPSILKMPKLQDILTW